jgi:hypothetical protein
MTFTIKPTTAQSKFTVTFNRQGHGVRLVATNLTADEAQRGIDQIAEVCGQPVTPWTGPDSDEPHAIDLAYVNESDEEGCGFYVLSEEARR